jgi:hypothetical protein
MDDLIQLVLAYQKAAELADRERLGDAIFTQLEPELRRYVKGKIRPPFVDDVLQEVLKAVVISRPAPDLAIIDVGRKGIGAEFGPPRVKDRPGAEVVRFGSEEHTAIMMPNHRDTRVGDRVEIIPSHGCTTSNLYREFVVHRGGVVEDVWPIEGSGRQR